MKFDPTNPYITNLESSMKLIQQDFFRVYICPDCQTPCERRLKEPPNNSRYNSETSPSFFSGRDGSKDRWIGSCGCLRLRKYSFYNEATPALMFKVSDSLQWMAYYPNGSYSDLVLKIVDGALFDPDAAHASKAVLEYNYLPSFVFLPLDQMIRRVETLATFQ